MTLDPSPPLNRLATGMNDTDYSVLTAALSPNVTMNTEQGWEESTDAAITHLLRTTLSKNAREAGAGVVNALLHSYLCYLPEL